MEETLEKTKETLDEMQNIVGETISKFDEILRGKIKYQAIIILKPYVLKGNKKINTDIDYLIDKIQIQMANFCNVLKTEKVGEKELAYSVQNYNKGYYLSIDFNGTKSLEDVNRIEKIFRNEDYVLKFITVRIED